MSLSEDNEVWTRRQSSVVEANRYMFDHQVACDVTFLLVQESAVRLVPEATGTVVPVTAHKYVLSSRSPVFFAMFCGQLADNSREIRIEDIPANVFKELLRFLYCEEANLSHTNVMYLLYAAKKYLVNPLINLCVDFIKQALTAEHVCNILEQALAFSDDELIAKCLTFISENTTDVIESDTFMEISETTLLMIVQLAEVSSPEVELFQACVAWAKHALGSAVGSQDEQITPADLRTSLKNIIPHIRFPAMTLEEYATHVVPLSLLITDEVCQVYQYLTCPVKPQTRFLTTSRCSEIQQQLVVLGTDYEEVLLHGNTQFEVECRGSTNKSLRLESLLFIAGTEVASFNPILQAEYVPCISYIKLEQSGNNKRLTFGSGPHAFNFGINVVQNVNVPSNCLLVPGKSVQFGSKNHCVSQLDFGPQALVIHSGEFKLSYSFNTDSIAQSRRQPVRLGLASVVSPPMGLHVKPVENFEFRSKGLKLSMACQRGPLCGLTVSTESNRRK